MGQSPEPFEQLARELGIRGALQRVCPLGSGHIHETVLAEYGDAAHPERFVHQKLNTHVFKHPALLMQNFLLVTQQIRAALERRAAREPERRCLRLIRCTSGELSVTDRGGNVWRTTAFIGGAHSIDVVERPEQAFEAARAFGGFAADLAGLDPAALEEPLPHFHDLDQRLRALERAFRLDTHARAASVREEMQHLVDAHTELARSLATRGFSRVRRRVVHNDCKINNVLFDTASDTALCVIDLDTVMQGTLLCDFGDLVRTAASTAREDEPDLGSVRFDLDAFCALTRGYLAGIGAAIDAAERGLLAIAGPALTLENAMRFLTDHLEGDIYFRIQRHQHNLDRARAQLALFDAMWRALTAAERLVADARG
jgi:Phosphotransferase enzyme family